MAACAAAARKAGRKAEAAGDSCLVAAAVAGCSPAAVTGCSCFAAVTGVAGCSAAVAGCSAATRARMLRRGRHESASRGRKVANQELRQKNGWKACRAFYFEAEERRIDEQYRTCTVCTKMSRKARVAAPRARATRPLVWRTIQLSPGRGRGLRAGWPMAQLWPRTCRVSFYSLLLFP